MPVYAETPVGPTLSGFHNTTSKMTLQRKPLYQSTPTDVDVVIVGAGLSGLRAADELHRAGFSVAVLESLGRVGGKIRSVRGSPGIGCGTEGWVELGAAWINTKTQREMARLVKRFKLETIEQQSTGRGLKQNKDGAVEVAEDRFPVRHRYKGRYSVLASMVRSYSEGKKEIDDPLLEMYAWLDTFSQVKHGPDARFLDGVTFAALVKANFPGEETESAADLLTGVFFGVGAEEVSSLYVLEHIKSCKGLQKIASVMEDGGHHQRIRQGAQRLASCLADQIPLESLHLCTAVTKITQRSGGCSIETFNGAVFTSKRVILSIPTTQYRNIAFDPPLPSCKRILAARTLSGWSTKVALVYDTLWWREAGLSGSMESTKGPVIFTRENCNERDGLYAIECCIGGEAGRGWFDMATEKRKTLVLGQLAEVFGAEVGVDGTSIPDPVRTFPKDWKIDSVQERMADGQVEIMPVGILSGEAGKSICKPFDRIHFVGAETASVWKGHLEGAVRSGIRGAKEVIAELRKERHPPRVWARL